ncbi:MAG: exodeoxyribonuclease III [Candidatus Vogelbacteria bacterium]|nr:exodeoxyribonuclease III [Candidatus Vogelbacteria bacterium]
MSFKLISWNVNGIRAAERKGFIGFLAEHQFDVVSVQETKVHDPNLLLSEKLRAPAGYTSVWNSATERKGYSGVAVFSAKQPKLVTDDFGKSLLSTEGRVLMCKYEGFTLLNIYFPNGGGEDHRLEYKLKFFGEFLDYVKKLKKEGHKIIFCGDVNVAHHPIDLARPKENINSIGFLPQERAWLDAFEVAGFVDTFRHFYPDKVAYSWWDMKTRARDRNIGWRLDYFWVDKALLPQVKEAFILGDIEGSDHAPVGITLDL